MTHLPPNLASQLALLSYAIEQNNSALVLPEMVKRHFKFNLKNIQKGTSGGFFWRVETGFALIGQGHGTHYSNDHVIAIRGTNTKADAITDITCHCTNSDSGNSVHRGFQSTFSSLRDGIAKYMNQPDVLNGSGIIHCVGKKDFATKTSTRIDKIFRCVHAADPVAKVPVWPYFHAPINGTEFVSSRVQDISPAAHSMLKPPGYINTANHDQWDNIYSQKGLSISQRVILNYEDRLHAFYSTHWADKIMAALITALCYGGYTALVGSLQASAAAIGTVYDLMAQAVTKIAAMAGYEEQVRGLLGHMIVFAGLGAGIPIKLTYSFIKWVFDSVIGRLLKAAKMALQSIA